MAEMLQPLDNYLFGDNESFSSLGLFGSTIEPLSVITETIEPVGIMTEPMELSVFTEPLEPFTFPLGLSPPTTPRVTCTATRSSSPTEPMSTLSVPMISPTGHLGSPTGHLGSPTGHLGSPTGQWSIPSGKLSSHAGKVGSPPAETSSNYKKRTSPARIGSSLGSGQLGSPIAPGRLGSARMPLTSPTGGLSRSTGLLGSNAGRYGRPPGGLGSPPGRFRRSSGGLGSPTGGLGKPRLCSPTGGFVRPSGGLGSPTGGFARSSGGLGSPTGGLGKPRLCSPSGGFVRPSGGLGSPTGGLGKPRLCSPTGGMGQPRFCSPTRRLGSAISPSRLSSPGFLGSPTGGLGSSGLFGSHTGFLGSSTGLLGSPTGQHGSPSGRYGSPPGPLSTFTSQMHSPNDLLSSSFSQLGDASSQSYSTVQLRSPPTTGRGGPFELLTSSIEQISGSPHKLITPFGQQTTCSNRFISPLPQANTATRTVSHTASSPASGLVAVTLTSQPGGSTSQTTIPIRQLSRNLCGSIKLVRSPTGQHATRLAQANANLKLQTSSQSGLIGHTSTTTAQSSTITLGQISPLKLFTPNPPTSSTAVPFGGTRQVTIQTGPVNKPIAQQTTPIKLFRGPTGQYTTTVPPAVSSSTSFIRPTRTVGSPIRQTSAALKLFSGLAAHSTTASPSNSTATFVKPAPKNTGHSGLNKLIIGPYPTATRSLSSMAPYRSTSKLLSNPVMSFISSAEKPSTHAKQSSATLKLVTCSSSRLFNPVTPSGFTGKLGKPTNVHGMNTPSPTRHPSSSSGNLPKTTETVTSTSGLFARPAAHSVRPPAPTNSSGQVLRSPPGLETTVPHSTDSTNHKPFLTTPTSQSSTQASSSKKQKKSSDHKKGNARKKSEKTETEKSAKSSKKSGRSSRKSGHSSKKSGDTTKKSGHSNKKSGGSGKKHGHEGI